MLLLLGAEEAKDNSDSSVSAAVKLDAPRRLRFRLIRQIGEPSRFVRATTSDRYCASENLDLVRSMYAARERGDWSWTDWAHPEVEFVIADGPNPGKWFGLAGMTEGWRSWASAWKGSRSEAEEYRELDEEVYLCSSK